MLCVKGCGWDMAVIEPPGLPAVKLGPCVSCASSRALRRGHGQRPARQPARPAAPNPSVETLLHAFLPHNFIDHTHADRRAALVDQPNGEELCAEVFGGGMGFVPYVMPGFGLAKSAAEVFDANPTSKA